MDRRLRNRKRRGQAVIEIALMTPWIFLLFLAVFDFGFYAYAAICTANAARVAVLYTSSGAGAASDPAPYTGCQYALAELQSLPSVAGISCPANALPVTISATPVSAAASPDGAPGARVSVTYQTVPLFPIPGLMGQMTITRTAMMRVQ